MPPKKQTLEERLSIPSVAEEETSKFIFHKHRLASFKKYCFDKKKGAKCTSAKLAAAGFYFTGTKTDPSSARCAFCLKEMVFDPEDDPWEEHVSRDNCEFVFIGKQDESALTVEDMLRLIVFRKSSLEFVTYHEKMRATIQNCTDSLLKMVDQLQE